MDSMDLEREKGITILAKNTAVLHHAPDGSERHHQHHRHPGPRRLRRRGRARPGDGRRRAAAGRRLRGPAAPDPVRAPQGAGQEAADHRGGQQGRPRRRPDRRGGGGDVRAVPGPARRRRDPRAGLPGGLRLGQGRSRLADRSRPTARCPRRADLGPLFADDPRRTSRPRPTPRARRCRPTSPTWTPRRTWAGWRCAGSSPGTMRRNQVVAWCRSDGTITDVKLSEMLITKALDRVPAEIGRPGRHRRHRRHPRHHHRRDAVRPRRTRKPLPLITVDEPSHLDDHRHQHLPAGRQVRQEPHRPAGQGPARRRAGRQRVDPGASRPSGPTPGRSRAAASCSWPSWSR